MDIRTTAVPHAFLGMAVLLLLALAGCNSEPSAPAEEGEETPRSAYWKVDTIKTRKDPKGGFFGPSLRDVYLQGQDTPIVFCDSGPDIPTGVRSTIFYREVNSTPSSSGCKKVVAVIEGPGDWVNGKAVTKEQILRERDREEHFIPYAHAWLRSRNAMELAWANPKPVGPPCPASDGDLKWRYRGQKCSIAVVDSGRGRLELVNWTITGRVTTGAYSPEQVIEIIREKAGDEYVVAAD